MQSSGKFIWLILTHQPAQQVARMIDGWKKLVEGDVVILYGGRRAEFDKIEHQPKRFVEDERLVTRDHQRERQSYDGVFEQALDVVAQSKADFVYFTEFDQIPMRSDIAAYLSGMMDARGLDFMGYGLQRIDGTSHPHWLNHDFDSGLEKALARVSLRDHKKVVLSAYGFGQCWRREGFLKVASVRQTERVYLELWIPSMAYHLGLHVGNQRNDSDWNTPMGVIDERKLSTLKEKEKPYFVHPIKGYWASQEKRNI